MRNDIIRKVSFTGDMMSWIPQNRVAWRGGNCFNYSSTFTQILPLLSESDVVVGNLETPIAGEHMGYTNPINETIFNTPPNRVC